MVDPFDLLSAPQGEPSTLVIGQSAQWRREVAVDSSRFSLAYKLRPETGGAAVADDIDLTFLSGHTWAADVLPATLGTTTAGGYFWDLTVTRIADGRSRVLDSGYWQVFGSDGDRRSHARIMVQKIESLLENRADDDVANYSIKQRSITKMSVEELRQWREYYRRELAAEDIHRIDGIFAKAPVNKSSMRVRFK